MDKTLAKIIVLVITASIVVVTVSLLTSTGAIPREISPLIIYSAIVLIFGFWFVNIISGVTFRMLEPKVGDRAHTAKNLVKFFGYVVVLVVALSVLGVSPEVALAGGTFSGLVIGLGAQPLLSNFFAGVVLLLTGVIRAGDEVRLLTNSIPYQPVLFPPHKFFSPDYINIGYKGRVIEVGLLYSTLITDTGLELKIPNRLVLDSGILTYESEYSPLRRLQVRYEFNVNYDPDVVLPKIRDSLSDIEEVNSVYINEQSDKQYYIVMIEFSSPKKGEWKHLKSEILRRLVKVHRALINNNAQVKSLE